MNLTGGPDAAIVRDYARRSGLPAKRLPRLRGTATGWQNTRFPQASAFVVELHGGALSAAGARRHARAVLAVGASQVVRASAAAARPADRLVADPVRRRPRPPDARLRAPPLRPRPRAAARAEGDRRALHGLQHLRAGVQHVRGQLARRRVRRAARRLRALHRRPRRHDPPARAAEVDVPAHGRAQPRRDRDRARRGVRRRRDGPPPPAGRVAASSRAGSRTATGSATAT